MRLAAGVAAAAFALEFALVVLFIAVALHDKRSRARDCFRYELVTATLLRTKKK